MSNFCQQGDITKIFIVDTGNTGSTGTDIYVTGGTYFGGTLTLGRNDGVNISIPGFLTGSTSADIYVTGGTYFGGTLTLGRNDGVTIPITGFSTTSIFTGNTSASCITDLYITNLHGCSPITIWDPIVSLSSISATTYYGDGSNLSGIPDYYVTGGTYSNGTLTLNRQNGSLNVTGFLTGGTGIVVDTYVTGFTYLNNNLSINQNQGQLPLTVNISIMTGLTINGSLSASTYLGLPIDPDYYVTGGTYSNGVLTLNRQNGSVVIGGLLSADTYVTGFTFNTGTYDLTIFQNNGVAPLIQNLGILAGDITVTGGTYNPNNGVATFFNNVGGSFQVPGFLTGFTDIYLSSGAYNPNTGNLTLTRTDNVSVTVTGFTDYYVTGGTYSNGSLTLNRQNGSVIITGFTTSSSSGGTGIDTYVTGFTYSNNNLSINQNQGQSPLTVTINNFTGLTINGSLSASTYLGLPSFTFTGNTSASCISDIYVSNLHGCSPITIHDSIKSIGSSATGITSFAFGNTTVAAGDYSHTEGVGTNANGTGSHAEGYYTQANGNYSHSQGASTVAGGDYSFASGSGSTAQGALSFVHSINSVAAGEGTVVLGGVGISGTTPNMVYVSTLNINSTPVNDDTLTQILVRDSSNGDVKYRDSSTLGGSGGTGIDTYVTGFTYSNNNLSINQNQGQSPLTVTINNFTGLTINGSLSATTYLGFPSNIYETTTDGAVTSASTSNVYTSGVLVPANSFTVGNNAEVTVRGRKTGTAGNMTMRVYINTINSISGSPILVATNTTAATNQTYLQFQRFLSIKSTGTTEVFSTTGGSNIDWLSSNLGINQLSVNWANDLYIVVATQCTVGTDSINARSSFIKIKR